MASPVLIKNRYEIKDVLGRGGMGVVYQAFDGLMRREVAVKTLRDAASSVFVDLFYRECSVLTAMVHPNIVEIFDMGEFEEDGVLKPYFVMPLLAGRTLYDLIYPGGQALPVERCTDIISQACRGLHAAHESGLLHRDIKPRNIFVMRDDAVKLIDFGVVRLLGNQTIGATGILGTPQYMAPEQLSTKQLSARSDIFSLATVCYEALTGVQPFIRDNEAETAAAVAEHSPALACTLNPQVNRSLAQAVAEGMAKDPRNRFESAAAFADALQRGLRNERPGAHLLANPQNRLARAQRSFARGDYQFAQEILEQLAAEGVESPEAAKLRTQLQQAVRKQESEVQLAAARRYFSEEEYLLALRHVTEVLASQPSQQAALALKNEIEVKLRRRHVADSLERASEHLDSGAFPEARRLIEDSLRLEPENAQARRLLKEADQRAADWPRQRRQQEEVFQTAQAAYFEGRYDTSLRALEQLAELTRQSKAAGERAREYEDFYKRVRGDYEALQAMLADARKLLASGDLESAYVLSERLREQCSQDPDVRTLSKDIATRREEREQDYRRGITRRIAGEPDLSAKLHILNQAARAKPNDDFFQQERQKLQAQLQQVSELVQRAQAYESSSHFEYALEEWLCVGDVYPAYPGLQEHLRRVREAWEAAREKTKIELKSSVASAVKRGDQERAESLLQAVAADFDGDADYLELKALSDTAGKAHKEVPVLLDRMHKAESERRFADIPTLAQTAAAASVHVDTLRQRTFNALTGSAARLVGSNWRVAQQVIQETARLGTVPVELNDALKREAREDQVTGILAEDRENSTDLVGYRERVATLLAKYPGEVRLEDRLRVIDAALADQRRQDEKRSCAAELALMAQELGDATDHGRLWDTYIVAKNVAAPFIDDPEIAHLLAAVGEQSATFEEAAEALSRDRIRDCFAICDNMLARRPGHRLFQKLRARADARYRQLGDEYLARVERWLASEPDPFQRELILQKAQAEYPFEPRYAEELKQLEREKAIAESLADKAWDLEKRGQTAEALAHWRQLRNLSPAYPGLEERIGNCESIIDRQQRKLRAQRLVSQGEAQLGAGQFAEGYQAIYEASVLSQDVPDLLRATAPNLVIAARAVLPTSPKLAEAMVDLAQALDDALRVHKDLRAKIGEARKAEDTVDTLKAIKVHHERADLPNALTAANEFLAQYPGVKQVETVRARLLVEIEHESKQRARAQALERLREIELSAVNMGPTELLHQKESVHELARLNAGEVEVQERAFTLDSLFTALAEVRGYLLGHAATKAEEACARAFTVFPGHPLFKSALVEAEKQKADLIAQYIQQTKQRAALESDFSKQAEILRDALTRYPENSDLVAELASVAAKQNELNEQIDKARGLEAKHLFGEATKAWEALGKAYPWYPGVNAEMERIANVRRVEKQEALDRWLRQVEEAIENGDYDTASAMIRQAAQQRPDRTLQALQQKLDEGLKKKQESDAQFAEGSRLLADGDLAGGGNALYRAYELQPKNQDKANSIALLLLGQIRANMASNMASCDGLLAHLNRIRPGQMLPPDISEAFGQHQKATQPSEAHHRTMMLKLSSLATQAQTATSDTALFLVTKKLQAAGLLDSNDLEVRRTATELFRQVNLRISGLETQSKGKKTKQIPALAERRLIAGGIGAVLLMLALAGVVLFWLRLHRPGVPLRISVTPEHANIELDGRKCVAPDCSFVLKPGEHLIFLSKLGYQPKTVSVTVHRGESTPLDVNAKLEPAVDPSLAAVPMDRGQSPIVPVQGSDQSAALSKIEIRGARPRTRIRLDGSDIGSVADDGKFRADVPAGSHTLDLSLDGFSNRTITRDFARGGTVLLADDAVKLAPRSERRIQE